MMRRLLLSLVLATILAPSVMALDLQSIRHRAEWLLGQDTAATNKNWPDAVLNGWIDDGIMFVTAAAKCVERETTLTILADSTDYAMPSDFIKVQGVVFKRTGAATELSWSPRGLAETESNQMGKESGQRSHGPRQYLDLGPVTKKIRLSPTPMGSDYAFVSYLAYGSSLSADTSTCDVPRAFQSAVASYAAWKAWGVTRVGNPYFDMMMNELQRLVPSLAKRQEQEPLSETASP